MALDPGELDRPQRVALLLVVPDDTRHPGQRRVDGERGALRDEGEVFDTLILDPPAFIKRRKDEKEGLGAYTRLNRLGMELVAPGGLLVTSSCSFHMGRDAFVRVVQQSARRAGRTAQLLEVGQQGPDHPVHPAIPETAYLKTLFLRVLPE